VETQRKGLAQAQALIRRAALLEEAVSALRLLKPRKGKRTTYRVVVQRRSGRHAYVRQELGKRVARAIGARFPSWKWVAEDASVEIWVLQRGDEVVCGLRLSDRTMRHRTYRRVSIEASLRPVLARGMVLLSEPDDGDVFLDPMCGAGTILVERGEHGRYRQLLGGDIRPAAVAAARANIGPRYQPIEIREWDATALPLPDRAVSRIACNLPFGRKVGSPRENRTLYAGFAAEAARVLRKGGVMVLLTSERRLLKEALGRCPEVAVERICPVFVLGRKAYIFKTRRTA
jgi:23S rRNA G2445 N2-methylase RlmL